MSSQDKYSAPFPTNLRAIIEEKGVTITALANELGISRQAVSQYADGTGQPNADKLTRIADYFGVSTDWLLGRSGGVKTVDGDVQTVCKLTGFSEELVDWFIKNNHVFQAHKNELEVCSPTEQLDRLFSPHIDRFAIVLFSQFAALKQIEKIYDETKIELSKMDKTDDVAADFIWEQFNKMDSSKDRLRYNRFELIDCFTELVDDLEQREKVEENICAMNDLCRRFLPEEAIHSWKLWIKIMEWAATQQPDGTAPEDEGGGLIAPPSP